VPYLSWVLDRDISVVLLIEDLQKYLFLLPNEITHVDISNEYKKYVNRRFESDNVDAFCISHSNQQPCYKD
jgi:hypothetical protein